MIFKLTSSVRARRCALLGSTTLLGFLAALPVAAPVRAQTAAWSADAASTDWFEAGNWVPGGSAPPVSGTVNIGTTSAGAASAGTAVIGSGSVSLANLALGTAATTGVMPGTSGTLTIDPGASLALAGYLRVGTAGTGKLNIDGGRVTLNGAFAVGGNNSGVASPGLGGVGHVAITNGGTLTTNTGTDSIIGYHPVGTSTILIDGDASTWNAFGSIIIGGVGTSVSNPASGSGGFAEVTVSGGGKLNLTDGHNSDTNKGIGLADGTHGTGRLTVTGAGSTVISTPGITVGIEGTGTLEILDGGRLETGAALYDYDYLGFDGSPSANVKANGIVLVDGAASSWVNHTGLVVGYGGDATLTIRNGGHVASTFDSYIGLNGIAKLDPAVGQVLITGRDSTWEVQTLDMAVFNEASGTLTVADGGTLKTTNAGAPNGLTPCIADICAGNGGLAMINVGAAPGQVAVAPGFIETRSIELMRADSRINFNHTDASGGYIFAASVSGPGHVLVQAGTTVFVGDNSYTGGTTISAGMLQAGTADTFSPNSAVTVAGPGTLDLNGFSQTVAGLGNAGLVSMGAGTAPGTVLTVAGDYVGLGGTIVFNTRLGDDGSATDLLRIVGNSTGTSLVKVVNAGGLGAQTDNGIKVIDVAGTSDGTFVLVGDFTTSTGRPAVVGGAYAYTLDQGGKADPADGDWYLRSALTDPEGPEGPEGPQGPEGPEPLFNPGTPLYESYGAVLLGMNGLPTLRQRVGYRAWADGAAGPARTGGVWGRFDGAFGRFRPDRSTTGTTRERDGYTFNLGADFSLIDDTGGAMLVGGINGRYAIDRSDIGSAEGTGRIRTDGYGLGATLTWYGANGFYADAQAAVDWYTGDLVSHTAGRTMADNIKGHGLAASLEAGWQNGMGHGFKLTPQVQLVWSRVTFAAFDDAFGARVSGGRGESLRGRLGLALDHESSGTDTEGRRRTAHFYIVPSLTYEFLDGAKVTVSDADGANPVRFANRQDRLWGGLGIGHISSWHDGKVALYGEVTFDTSLANLWASRELHTRIGARIKW
ncbi:MAG: autotransporter outer membrane beta-barrel domain-containing protein [Novosphingobium sp.]|jgi:outer membrane autotransporter protein|nr:autotransporter outer membrane beta-barrel domain-containing protein [Novosphingobium sp.]